MECGLISPGGKRKESYDHCSQALELGAGAGSAPKYLGELIVLCLIGWKRETGPKARNVHKWELEGAWLGAGGPNPLRFVSSKCVFSSCQHFSQAEELDTATSIPSTSNTLVGEIYSS